MISCTRRLSFDAGHRILGHEGKCAHLHGHRYDVEITCVNESQFLDKLGRVVDFGQIKERVGAWIDKHLDHNMILHRDDPILEWVGTGKTFNDIHGRTPYVMSINPTAENLARHIYEQASAILKECHIEVQQVRVYETPNCWADSPGTSKR